MNPLESSLNHLPTKGQNSEKTSPRDLVVTGERCSFMFVVPGTSEIMRFEQNIVINEINS